MNFDLNIENYNRDELIEMFELPSNFDRNIVEIKEARLKDSIINNKEINKETQVKTLNFLLKAKNIILNDSQEPKNGTLQQKIQDFYNSSYELKTSKLENQEEHMIQIRPEKPYLSSYPSEFFPGIINPIKKRTIRKNLNIDTKFRENYYTSSASNFNFVLPISINNVLQMQLASIELPTTYYAVSKQYGNNFFSITVDASASIVINIPDGNYDQLTIMNAINNQLTLAGGAYANVVFTTNITNGTTGSGQTLVGFSDSTSGHTKLELNFQADRFGISDRNTPLPLKFGWTLGFRNGIYVGNKNYVSEGVVDVTGPKYLFLVVDDYTNNVNNNFYSAFNSSILNKNILSRISLQANTFNVLEQNNLSLITTPREYFGPVNINNLTIQLLDEYGRIVDLNNMDFSFCLNLTTVYDL
jgi:hypothetical protein